ncbi:hypothetical protein L1987_12767 [Smallanthus sonchifolius]|uniref:Uncharacterized protein n=1 Tax=Smallanthus sonchifolius TaxID=185202 RepID=A0ACB9JHA6_9ASTR|nr:hypothetical protein L1987_12767 [Smallanthus sonchifolius]
MDEGHGHDQKVVETMLAGNYVEMELDGKPKNVKSTISNFFWHGGSAYDAWFSCSSNQVAQVLLTLPYSFSQLGMLSWILFQIFYGLMGSWTAYLISISMLNTELERKETRLISETMSYRFVPYAVKVVPYIGFDFG